MNDFDYDVKEKKRIAQGAKYKKHAKKGCTLPSDNMTPAQKRKLNGEVKTMAMNKPITWAELNSYPADVQREYINGLREKYQATDRMLGKMLGVTDSAVQIKRKDLGGEWTHIPSRLSYKDTDARNELWAEFLGEDPEKILRFCEPEEKPEPPKCVVRSEVNVTIAGAETWEDVLAVLKTYPVGKVIDIHIGEGDMP